MSTTQLIEKVESESCESVYFRKKNLSIPAIFEKVVSVFPDETAIITEQITLTYKVLNEKANRLANYIRFSQKVESGSVIGLYADSSEKTIISILAILKAGCTYLPLDSKYPEERIRYMAGDARISVLIIESQFIEAVYLFDCPYLLLDDICEITRNESSENPEICGSSEDVAYIMYTSGTTGKPNGVLIPQKGIIRLISSDYVPFSNKQTFLQLAPLGFDASTFEIWGALLHGAKLIIFGNHIPEFGRIHLFIKKFKVSCLWLTAALFNAIIDEAPEILIDIAYLLTGGEALSVAHIRKAQRVLPNAVIVNGYGPTECTTFTCTYRIPLISDSNLKSIPIGKPICSTNLYLLNENLLKVNKGEVGELYVAGDGLALGYINNEELTNERFITHNTLESKSVRLYKTGDLCKELPDGNLDFVGRTDFQVKINGFRIEIDEIEICLKKYLYIADAVVLIKQKGDLKRIVAYVIPRLNNEKSHSKNRSFQVVNLLEHNALAKYMLSWLPAYMIPNEIIELTNFPININGKIDRKALIDIEIKDSTVENKDYFEGKEFEIKILCERMLSIKIIYRADNFFELGAESLSVAQLIFHVSRTYFVEVPINHFYNEPTLANLIRIINQEHTEEYIYINNCIRRSNLLVEKIENQEISQLINEFSVVKMKDGDDIPLFIAPGMLGNAFLFVEFCKNLKSNHPVYIFEYPIRQNGTFVTQTIEELAAYYLTNIKELFPTGPFHLAGFSFGGRLIFEIARLLESENQKVETLTIIDAEGFHRKKRFNHSKIELEAFIFLKLPLNLKIKYLYKRQLAKAFQKMRALLQHHETKNTTEGLTQYQKEKDYLKLWYNFHSEEKLKCDMYLIKGVQEEWDSLLYYIKLIKPDMYFAGSTVGKLKMIEINCNHMGFFKSPHAIEFAHKIQQIISKQI